MKNKKGFTLVELLSVIALIGVVITIAGLSISSVSVKVKESQMSKIESRIKIAAEKYMADTGINIVFVQTLIDDGYIEADDEEGAIFNPTNSESINCYYVNVSDNEVKLNASDTCDESIVEDAILSIKLCTDASCSSPIDIDKNKWYNYDNPIYLKAVSLNSEVLNLEETSAMYKWISPLAPDVYNNDMYYKVKMNDGYVKGIIEAIVTVAGKSYSASTDLKHDSKDPTVSDIDVAHKDVYKNKKVISAVISDNESGLSAYSITKDENEPTTWTNIDGSKKTISKEVTENGTWYVWVKDVAGNTNASTINESKIEVSKVDSIAPECVYQGENDTWTTNDVTIRYGCKDNLSGCTNNIIEKKYTSSTKIESLESFEISDNAGNKTVCPAKMVNIYVDKEKPKVTQINITSNKGYNALENVTVEIKAEDNYSGVAYVCITEYEECIGSDWMPVSNNQKYNYSFETIGYSKDNQTANLKVYVKDGAGNISEVKYKEYIPYQLCSKKTASSYGEWGDCSKSCGGGTKYRSVKYKDSYFSNVDCGTDPKGDSKSCNTQACCSEGTYTYSYCSDSGYEVHRRYNECKSKYEYKTTSTACESDTTCNSGTCNSKGWETQSCYYYYGGTRYSAGTEKVACQSESKSSASACSSLGWKTITPYYYKGGTKYNESSYNEPCHSTSKCTSDSSCSSRGWITESCYHYYGGVYQDDGEDTTACTSSDSCGSWSACSNNSQSRTCTYYYGGQKQSYTDTQSCSSEPEVDTINGIRYSGCDSYYITTCEPTNSGTCKYTQKNGVSSSGTIKRGKLTYSPNADACAKEAVKECNAYIKSASNGVVKFTLSGDCESESAKITSGSCSVDETGSTTLYVDYNSVSFGSKCGIKWSISGSHYIYGGQAMGSISWQTEKCSASSARGEGWYCTNGCKKTNTACAD